MKISAIAIIVGLASAVLMSGKSYAQQNQDASDLSLGDLARKLNAQRAKEPKSAKVITNDDIEGLGEGTLKFAGHPKAKGSAEPAPPESGSPPEVHDEKYFREKMTTLQNRLDTDKRELEVLQQKLSQSDLQYYPNPNKALQQQYSRQDINKLTADLDAKKDQIAEDEEAIEDLHDELRRDQGDPSWLR